MQLSSCIVLPSCVFFVCVTKGMTNSCGGSLCNVNKRRRSMLVQYIYMPFINKEEC